MNLDEVIAKHTMALLRGNAKVVLASQVKTIVEDFCKIQRELMCVRVMKTENTNIVDILNVLSNSPLASDSKD